MGLSVIRYCGKNRDFRTEKSINSHAPTKELWDMPPFHGLDCDATEVWLCLILNNNLRYCIRTDCGITCAKILWSLVKTGTAELKNHQTAMPQQKSCGISHLSTG